MTTYRPLIIFLILALVFSLSACQRPIPGSQTESPSNTGQENELTPGATDVMGQIYLFATQTAMATQGSNTAPSGKKTPNADKTKTAKANEIESVNPQKTKKPSSSGKEVPTATPGLPSNYTLKAHEFPYCIARRFNVNPNELLQVNGLSSYSVYYTGMSLKIPQSGQSFPGNRSLRPHPTTYTVRPGDTIYKIACIFGDLDPEMIAYANGLKKPFAISPGQILQIP